ncbi:MAG: hypothetical protein ACYS8I_06315 [Planctomycetota bacterium]|jgi:peptidoglycan/LPS O-acetylase OafA/YrhL
MWFRKKTSPRRTQLRKSRGPERLSQLGWLADADNVISAMLWLLFVVLCIPILSFGLLKQARHREVIPIAIIVILVSAGGALYIKHYQRRIIRNHARALALAGLLILLLATAFDSAAGHGQVWSGADQSDFLGYRHGGDGGNHLDHCL